MCGIDSHTRLPAVPSDGSARICLAPSATADVYELQPLHAPSHEHPRPLQALRRWELAALNCWFNELHGRNACARHFHEPWWSITQPLRLV